MSIKLIVAFVLVGLVCYVLGRLSGARRSSRGGGQMIQSSAAPYTPGVPRVEAAPASALDAASFAEIKHLIHEGHLIGAIKVYRERTNCGLREAKDAVESIKRSLSAGREF
ncbi:MAG TPA: hypothetical protein VGW12_04235 [Pyrinomonadaceae bacterium]|nr:hypothetical protein [Pyrinomonadaceae bacterium]